MDILAKILEFVKTHFSDIILVVAVMLLLLFSFAAGFIVAKYQDRVPLQIYEKHTSTYSIVS